ncbi:unnamed protein product [Allacma fusca]|uniref:Carboxylesterase type B domain-containing protein n=1 Tax=Allacma fusca TaxID=39272 RepID=A0A8J2PEY2_9HEXA|nr:unnamed protein product [Allacma fusca]
MYGDRTLLTGIYEAMLEHSKLAPTYGYFFNYTGKFSVLERVGMTRKEAGISHYDDIIYLFNSSALHPSLSHSDKDYDMVKFLTDLWSNFASTKKPFHTNNKGEEVDVWTPLNHSQPRLFEISRTPGMIEFPLKFLKRIEFWQSLKIPD